MGSRRPFFVGTGFGGIYRNETNFQIEDFCRPVMLLATTATEGAKVVESPTDSYLVYRGEGCGRGGCGEDGG